VVQLWFWKAFLGAYRILRGSIVAQLWFSCMLFKGSFLFGGAIGFYVVQWWHKTSPKRRFVAKLVTPPL